MQSWPKHPQHSSEIEKKILKFLWKQKGSYIAKAIFNKKE